MATVNVKNNLHIYYKQGCFYHLDEQILTIDEIQQILNQEIQSLEYSECSTPTKIDEAKDIQAIEYLLKILLQIKLRGNEKILVIGAGQGIASVFFKYTYPHTYIVASDFTSFAVEKISKYEQMLQAKVDEKWVLNPVDTPFATAQFDIIISLDIFSHYSQVGCQNLITEMSRLLKPSGKILLLSEIHIPQYLSLLAKVLKPLKIFNNCMGDTINLRQLRHWTREMLCQMTFSFYPERQNSRPNHHDITGVGRYWRQITAPWSKNRINIIISKPIYNHEYFYQDRYHRCAKLKSLPLEQEMSQL